MSENILATGAEFLGSTLEACAGTLILYQQGTHQIATVATRGLRQHEQTTANGNIIRFQSQDFIINAASLVVDGQQLLPMSGDRIQDGSYTYEILMRDGRPSWSWCDPFHQRLRVHTKQVANP